MKNVYYATSKKYNISNFSENKQQLIQDNNWMEDLVITEIPRNEWLLSQVPVEFRDVLSYSAYEKGHYAGEEEVAIILENMIWELKPAIDKFEARIRAEKA